MGIATTNPTTGEVIKTFAALTDAEIEQALQRSQQAFEHYRHVSFQQ